MTDDLPEEGESAIVDLLFPLYEARTTKNEAERDADRLSRRVKTFLGTDHTRSLRDDHGIYTEWERKRTTTWDLRPLKAEQILALWHAGLLTMQTVAFDEMRKAAPSTTYDDVNGTPGVRLEGEQWSLLVKGPRK